MYLPIPTPLAFLFLVIASFAPIVTRWPGWRTAYYVVLFVCCGAAVVAAMLRMARQKRKEKRKRTLRQLRAETTEVARDVVEVVYPPRLVTVRLTPECWRFVNEARSWPALIPLPAGVHALFDGPPRIEIGGSFAEPRFVVQMTRSQAEALQRWLHPLQEDLKHDEVRRLTCLLCISRVAFEIMLSER
jgi:membrane protein implicated in regulation of membrane protease activity